MNLRDLAGLATKEIIVMKNEESRETLRSLAWLLEWMMVLLTGLGNREKSQSSSPNPC